MPKLSQFIRDHCEEILGEWETFARTLPMTQAMDVAALRDHARAMLVVIARDLDTAQTPGEQKQKAQGKSDASEAGSPSTAAQEHGAARAGSGFTIASMLSELRALRASVIRLWTRQQPQFEASDLVEMTRFNEAIDQAIAESVTQYSDDLAQTKDRFLAILGHDLRNPLGAIIMSASFMTSLDELTEPHRHLVARIESSARRMNQMVSDLLDFARTRFGDEAIPIVRAETDARRIVEDVVAEVSARYPESPVTLETEGDLHGHWDGARLSQMLTNLIGNAVQHGTTKAPIAVTARGSSADVEIAVKNDGPAISPAAIGRIFKEGVQLATDDTHNDEHLGLGLYIVERIVVAHGGTVSVTSTRKEGTTVTVHLPRAA